MTITLKQGDCLELMKELDDESVDLVLTDPPYNENYNYRGSEFKDYREDYYEFLREVLNECKRVLKPTGSLYMKHSSRQISTILPLASNILKFRNLIVWLNNSQAHPLLNYDSYYEPIYFLTKSNTYTFNKKAELRKQPPNYWSGEGKAFVGLLTNCFYDIKRVAAGCLSNVEGGTESNKKLHPCSMPIRLAERIIKVSSNEGATLLDPFMGSGTTGVACVQLSRNFIGYEISPDYFKIAEKRIKEAETQRKLSEFR